MLKQKNPLPDFCFFFKAIRFGLLAWIELFIWVWNSKEICFTFSKTFLLMHIPLVLMVKSHYLYQFSFHTSTEYFIEDSDWKFLNSQIFTSVFSLFSIRLENLDASVTISTFECFIIYVIFWDSPHTYLVFLLPFDFHM